MNDGRVVPSFITQALRNKPIAIQGDGNQTRSFCIVSDLISGIYKLMMSNETLPVNIGNPQEITILEFAKKVIEATGSRSRIVFKPPFPDDPKQRRPDISKAKERLKWEPQVPLEEGLLKTIEFLEKNIVYQPN
jgi:dTDP-glucose 4,6-dehydratase